jgi:predicted permease
MSWLSRVRNVFRSDRVSDELDEELSFHVESRARDLTAAGMDPEAAAREARRRLGNRVTLRERSLDVKLATGLESLVRDLRIGLRMLRRDLGVSVSAIASLALAIGGCTAAFALVDVLILRPLPVPEPGRLITLSIVEETRERTSFNYPLYQRLAAAARGRADFATFGWQGGPTTAVFDPATGEERVYSQYISGDGFGLLGLRPAIGRLILPSDDYPPGAHDVAVLSHAFWTRRFGADPRVIGRTLVLNRKHYEIVGVAPAGFTGIEPGIATTLWVPLTSTPTPEALTEAGWHWFRILGRLAPGHRADDVRDGLQPVLSAFLQERAAMFGDAPQAFRDRYVKGRLAVHPAPNGYSQLRTNFERPLWVLAAVVGLVLLLACSNLANLMLARGSAREREMALRLSIGAGRGRLVQQLLLEAGALAAAASVAGVVFARLAAPIIVALLAPSDTPAYLDVRFDGRVLLFVAGVGALATIAFGLVPALRVSGTSPIEAMKASSGRHTSRAPLLRPLVATQVAFSLAVLFLATLLLTSFARLATVDPGFVAEGVQLASVDLVDEADALRARDTTYRLVEQVRAMPGVTAAGLSRWPLFSGSGWDGTVLVDGRRPNDADVNFLEVTPGFIDALRIRLLAGRDLVRADFDAGSESVLVNQTFTRLFLGGGSPLGRRFTRPERSRTNAPTLQRPHQVVGLVSDAKYNDLRETAPPTIYLPLGVRDEPTADGGALAIRSRLPQRALAERVRAAAATMTPKMKLSDVTSQSTIVANTMLRERLLALLSGFFALVSLSLAAVGLYGVLSYSVVQQTREIGIRIALGAAERAVIRTVLGSVWTYVFAGIAVGLAAGLWLAQFVTALLYEVRPRDASSIAAPIAVLLVVALVASLLPARRAARVDPMVALRDE